MEQDFSHPLIVNDGTRSHWDNPWLFSHHWDWSLQPCWDNHGTQWWLKSAIIETITEHALDFSHHWRQSRNKTSAIIVNQEHARLQPSLRQWWNKTQPSLRQSRSKTSAIIETITEQDFSHHWDNHGTRLQPSLRQSRNMTSAIIVIETITEHALDFSHHWDNHGTRLHPSLRQSQNKTSAIIDDWKSCMNSRDWDNHGTSSLRPRNMIVLQPSLRQSRNKTSAIIKTITEFSHHWDNHGTRLQPSLKTITEHDFAMIDNDGWSLVPWLSLRQSRNMH